MLLYSTWYKAKPINSRQSRKVSICVLLKTAEDTSCPACGVNVSKIRVHIYRPTFVHESVDYNVSLISDMDWITVIKWRILLLTDTGPRWNMRAIGPCNRLELVVPMVRGLQRGRCPLDGEQVEGLLGGVEHAAQQHHARQQQRRVAFAVLTTAMEAMD